MMALEEIISEKGSPKIYQFILRGIQLSVYILMAVFSIAVEIHTKPQMSTSRWCWRKSQGITSIIRIHCPWTMTVCTRFCVITSTEVEVESLGFILWYTVDIYTKAHASPFSIWWDISVWSTKSYFLPQLVFLWWCCRALPNTGVLRSGDCEGHSLWFTIIFKLKTLSHPS